MDDKRLERIEAKVDDISEHLGSIDSTLAAQHVSLREHIRRTALLESELKPIKSHVDRVSGAIKMLGLVGTILAIIEAIRMFK